VAADLGLVAHTAQRDAHKTPEGRVFVGGHWRNEREWPPARTQTTPYYLHADGGL
jgi:predicted acyl esterase